jgi:hypothetical protein
VRSDTLAGKGASTACAVQPPTVQASVQLQAPGSIATSHLRSRHFSHSRTLAYVFATFAITGITVHTEHRVDRRSESRCENRENATTLHSNRRSIEIHDSLSVFRIAVN